MNEEQLQFAISQYVDGTLPPDQVSQIQTILKTDPEARRTFEQYRRLNEVLLETLPAPADGLGCAFPPDQSRH